MNHILAVFGSIIYGDWKRVLIKASYLSQVVIPIFKSGSFMAILAQL
jgi:hypothetical protein